MTIRLNNRNIKILLIFQIFLKLFSNDRRLCNVHIILEKFSFPKNSTVPYNIT